LPHGRCKMTENQKTVLIVDDDEVMRVYLKEVLKDGWGGPH